MDSVKRYDCLQLLNEHGDLYFYHIILVYKLFPINWRNGKIIIEGKKKEIELNASRVTRYASSGLRAARSPLLDYEIINYERLVENVQVDFV